MAASDPWGKRPGPQPAAADPWASFAPPSTTTANTNLLPPPPTTMEPLRPSAGFAPPQPQFWAPTQPAAAFGAIPGGFAGVGVGGPGVFPSASTSNMNGMGMGLGQQPQQGGGGIPFYGGGSEVMDNLARNPLTQVAAAYGRNLVQTNVARYAPGASAFLTSLRYYFDVNQSYVRAKLKKIVFPFVTKRWTRIPASEAGNGSGGVERHPGFPWAAPIFDENAPDLYLPAMAFLTYVLVCGLLKGTRMKFTPEVLVTTSSSGVLSAILEVAVLKLAMYALAVEDASLLDLTAYAGYKYVGLTLNALAGLAGGTSVYYLSLAYTGAAAAFFFINTLSPLVDPAARNNNNVNNGGINNSGNSSSASAAIKMQRNYLVLGAGALQILLMWWLGQSSDL